MHPKGCAPSNWSAGFSRQEMHTEGCALGHTKVCIPGGCPRQSALPPHHLKLPSHPCSLFGCFQRNWYTCLRKTNRCAQCSQNGRVPILMRCLNCAYPVMLHRACFCRFLYAVVSDCESARDCEVATDRADRGLFNNKRTVRCGNI